MGIKIIAHAGYLSLLASVCMATFKIAAQDKGRRLPGQGKLTRVVGSKKERV